jgi:hypothetical protein
MLLAVSSTINEEANNTVHCFGVSGCCGPSCYYISYSILEVALVLLQSHEVNASATLFMTVSVKFVHVLN